MKQSRAIIIGAGPAGLTAAVELLRRTGIQPIVIEATQEIGGISRTVRYKGNRMDIGGHRFFSKSDRVMKWWLEMMPMETVAGQAVEIQYHGKRREVSAAGPSPDPKGEDRVMLVRERKSRIYYLRRFFDYPLSLNARTLKKLGLMRTLRAGISYLRSALLPKREERTLEDFLINRFGKHLYWTFFKSYTEKVWGVPCDQISAEWGAQRIKGLSLKGVLLHFIKKHFRRSNASGVAQKDTETSLIERFIYPKYGPGQLWEHAAKIVQEAGGELHLGIAIDRVDVEGDRVVRIGGTNSSGERVMFEGDYFLSTMPVRDLIRAFTSEVPKEVAEVSEGLMYRDFVTVGLLAKKLAVNEEDGSLLRDNWIYVQEPDVQVGRLQIFNNWSPWLVASEDKVWVGLEYFCNDTDTLWNYSADEMKQLAIQEISKIGILNAEDVEDAHVVRVPKAYPAYFGSYDRFGTIRNYLDGFENLFLIGRNGMHKYNNQDHSMLTAMTAVDNMLHDVTSKENIWAINTEMEYHEEKHDEQADPLPNPVVAHS
jgi:protoporphyrinogen oxidase